VREFFKILKNKLTITTHSIFALKSTFNSIHNVVRERWLVKNLKEVFLLFPLIWMLTQMHCGSTLCKKSQPLFFFVLEELYSHDCRTIHKSVTSRRPSWTG
jgi:hypothetical protein